MGLLVRAGWAFKDAWTHVLQHALVTRTKARAAVRFGELKKRAFLTERVGPGLSGAARVRLAKR